MLQSRWMCDFYLLLPPHHTHTYIYIHIYIYIYIYLFIYLNFRSPWMISHGWKCWYASFLVIITNTIPPKNKRLGPKKLSKRSVFKRLLLNCFTKCFSKSFLKLCFKICYQKGCSSWFLNKTLKKNLKLNHLIDVFSKWSLKSPEIWISSKIL